jgi:hypothetical protein
MKTYIGIDPGKSGAMAILFQGEIATGRGEGNRTDGDR